MTVFEFLAPKLIQILFFQVFWLAAAKKASGLGTYLEYKSSAIIVVGTNLPTYLFYNHENRTI